MSILIDIDIDVMHKGTGDRRTLGRDLRAGQGPSSIHLISFGALRPLAVPCAPIHFSGSCISRILMRPAEARPLLAAETSLSLES